MTKVETMAKFCSGLSALLKALKINLVYPKESRSAEVQKSAGEFSHGLELTPTLTLKHCFQIYDLITYNVWTQILWIGFEAIKDAFCYKSLSMQLTEKVMLLSTSVIVLSLSFLAKYWVKRWNLTNFNIFTADQSIL